MQNSCRTCWANMLSSQQMKGLIAVGRLDCQNSQCCMCLLQPPECHAISRAAGDVLYTSEQVQQGLLLLSFHSLKPYPATFFTGK